jgi:hypothetical protein
MIVVVSVLLDHNERVVCLDTGVVRFTVGVAPVFVVVVTLDPLLFTSDSNSNLTVLFSTDVVPFGILVDLSLVVVMVVRG